MNRLPRCICFALACLGWHGALQAQPIETDCNVSLDVSSRRQGEHIELKVRLELPSPLPVAWAVITDYAGAGRFIHNLRHSEVSVLGPDELLVDQVGWLGWGIMGVSIQTKYRIRLNPAQHQLTGKLVSGDLSSMEMTASLLAPQSHRTVLLYAVSVDPGAWIPYFLAESVLRQQARDSFTDLAAEMQRRSQTCQTKPSISENPT